MASASCRRTASSTVSCSTCRLPTTSACRTHAACRRPAIVRTGAERDRRERWRSALRIRTPDVGQRVVFLSGGNQQKVVLAKWLASEADIFIFDEPTRGIDLAARREIYGLINDLAAKGAGILLISSELPEVLGMSAIACWSCAAAPSAATLPPATRPKRLRPQSRRWGSLRDGAAPVAARRHGSSAPSPASFALALLLSALTPLFLTVPNLLNVLEQTSINAIIAVGMTFVILSGGIDLSVGSVVALSGVVLGTRAQGRLAGSGRDRRRTRSSAAACGLFNGLLVTIGRLPPFIATLGMMSVARGLALMYVEGRPVSGFDEGFRALATARPLLVPMPAIVAALIAAAAYFVLTRTVFGRYVYAIGGNEEASRLSGVAVRFHKTAVYGVAGIMSGGGSGDSDRAAQLGAADRRHHVRARRHCRDRHRRHQPARRRRIARRHHHRRADHGRAAGTGSTCWAYRRSSSRSSSVSSSSAPCSSTRRSSADRREGGRTGAATEYQDASTVQRSHRRRHVSAGRCGLRRQGIGRPPPPTSRASPS